VLISCLFIFSLICDFVPLSLALTHFKGERENAGQVAPTRQSREGQNGVTAGAQVCGSCTAQRWRHATGGSGHRGGVVVRFTGIQGRPGVVLHQCMEYSLELSILWNFFQPYLLQVFFLSFWHFSQQYFNVLV
jgi:hypothetical protein